MSSTIPLTGRRAWTRSIQRPDRSVKADRFAPCVSTSVSNRPIWLVEAACPVTAAPPTTQRMAGSCASRSASLRSSYPAKRPNTDWRNCPTRVWRPFAPVRVSVSTSPAVSLRPRTSSSSRQASRPPSDVTFVPWNSSLRRRSNPSPRATSCASPNVASIRDTRHRPYHADDLTRIDAYRQCWTELSGECGIDALLKAVARWVTPKLAERAGPLQQPAGPPPVVLDEKYLATVEALVGREALQALSGSFQTELHQRLAAITAPEAECGTIEREAHALVSLAGNLGLVELSACSRQLTDTCRSAAEGDLPRRMRALNEAAERAVARLETVA